MIQEQTLELIPVEALLDKVRALREGGYRLVQVCANRFVDHVEITYSFDLDRKLANLRLSLPSTESKLPSISSIYGCVVLYENEIHDLFNIAVEGMALDFKGNLYRTTVKFPFGTVKAPPAKPAPTSASTPSPARPAATAPATAK
jgi:ech hydrogenase subunit D